MCLFPKLLPNPKYKATKKNNGNAPEMKDERVKMVPVGCGKCMECQKKRAREWQVRLQEELRTDNTGQFVTLTFSDEAIAEIGEDVETEGYERDNEIATIGVRRFLENWRSKHGKSVKHWLITELGHKGTKNIHLHGIIFSKDRESITKIWRHGFVFIGQYVNDRTINYCIKYATKIDQEHKYYKPKILTSPGIGKNYVNRYDAQNNKYTDDRETDETYKTRQGKKVALPIYWRNKLYSEEEREKLWLQKLDKNIRYVNKIAIDVSTPEGMKTYYKALEEAQKQNDRFGYGNNKENWSQKNYEIQRRNLNFKTRTKRATEWQYVDPETGEIFAKQNKKQTLIKIQKP